MDNTVLCVVGPTACGKTKMGVALARRFNGEVVSVDSMQLYRGMAIGTAAPTAEEMEGIPHHMVAVADPRESWSAARYAAEADKCVQDILHRGKRPVLVGGTGLYLDALVRGTDFAAGSQGGVIRQRLQQRMERQQRRRAAEEQSNVGKLIYGDTWYYAVVLPEEQAAELKTMGSINVRLAKGFDQTIRMSVESVSRPDKGRCAVVLSSTRYLAQTTLLRHQAADAVLHTYEGLRVPADALRVSEDGVTGVYCVDGENAAFRPVTLVYQGEGYALVKPAEGAGDTRTLRAGDQVIATSGQLHDGKVIR